MKLFKLKEFFADRYNAVPLAVSHDRLGNNVNELIATGLSDETEYLIEVLFAADTDDLEEKAQIECLIATMQVRIANSRSDFVCLKKRLNDLKAKHDLQSYPQVLSYDNLVDKGKHVLMVASNSKDTTLKPARYEIEIKDENAQLEVTIEGSDHFYGTTLQIIPEEKDDSSRSSAEKMANLLKKIYGSRDALPADRISSPKHMTKFLFSNVSPGRYIVRLH